MSIIIYIGWRTEMIGQNVVGELGRQGDERIRIRRIRRIRIRRIRIRRIRIRIRIRNEYNIYRSGKLK